MNRAEKSAPFAILSFRAQLLAFLNFMLLTQAFGDSLVVRNGHHRAIAVIVLVKQGKLSRDTVVGKFEDQKVTAGQLTDWYEADSLLAYNESHSPSHAEDILRNFDATEAVLPTPSNPAGGVIITRSFGNERLVSFRNMREHGSILKKPNCDDSMRRLIVGRTREQTMSYSTHH